MLGRPYAFVRKQDGVTLVELMIGLTVGALVLAGALTMFAKIIFSGLENTRAMRLNQQLRGTLDFIHRDLQRAGYVNAFDIATWGPDINGDYPGRVAMATKIDLSGVVTIGANSIEYRYDLDKDGVLDCDELFGFRLNAGAVESGRGTGNPCAVGGWQGMSSSEVTITTLTFTESVPDSITYEVVGDGVDAIAPLDNFADCGSGETCLHRRKIDVVLTGELVSDATVTMTLEDSVKIKNDRYFDMP